MKGLVNYQLATAGFKPRLEGGLYTYILAANGVFIYSGNEYFQAVVPVKDMTVMPGTIKGLIDIRPDFHVIERVWWGILYEMVSSAYRHLPNERLFFLKHPARAARWFMEEPLQKTDRSSVQAFGTPDQYYPIEVHSHNTMGAFFSKQDDREETGLRVYAVLGRIDRDNPEIAVRVGVYGNFMDLHYSEVFETNSLLLDSLRIEEGIDEP